MKKNLYKPEALNHFRDSLRKSNAAKATEKNYLTDVKQFLLWREQAEDGSVKKFIENISTQFSNASLKRKSSAIKRYLTIEGSYTQRPAYFRFGLVPALSLSVLALSIASLSNTQKDFTGQIKDADIADARNYTIVTAKSNYDFEKHREIMVVLPDAPSITSARAVNMETLEPISEASLSNSGEAKIAQGKTETLIANELVSSESFIYLTPTGPSNNQVLYVKIKGEGYMIVATERPAVEDIKFQWKVDNTKVYYNTL